MKERKVIITNIGYGRQDVQELGQQFLELLYQNLRLSSLTGNERRREEDSLPKNN